MDYKNALGFGVAGNFAGHLEQAGEAADFAKVVTKDAKAPKALFPFYLPGKGDSFLSVYPLSSSQIKYPAGADNLQIEPEVGVEFEIVYDGSGKVSALKPVCFGAYNDCSIRRQGAKKISEKKNWGPCSKGFSEKTVPLSSFAAGCELDGYRIASFLIRDGECFVYGVDSPTVGYSYFHENLTDWMIDRMNNQKDDGPAEDLASYIDDCGRPSRCVVSIGATRYTEFGESHFLKPGDTSVVVVYKEESHRPHAVFGLVCGQKFDEIDGCVLVQKVVE